MKLNKIAFGIALAAGVGAAQADEVLFPYVVSSPTVTTILSVANLHDNGVAAAERMHFTYWYKDGTRTPNGLTRAEQNSTTCDEVNRGFATSPNDLIDVSVDQHFGASSFGILFENGMFNAPYTPLNATSKPSLLSLVEKPIRAFAIVDNDDFVGGLAPFENSMIAGRATIIEFGSGAAWGYDGFNAKGVNGAKIFDEAAERFGEVFSPVDFATGDASARVPVSFKPFDEFATTFYVTPVFSRAIVAANTLAGGVPGGTTGGAYANLSDQQKKDIKAPTSVAALTALNLTTAATGKAVGALNSATAANVFGLTLGAGLTAPTATSQNIGNLVTRIEASVNNGVDVAYDRDENPVSGRTPQDVTCVGAVSIESLMSAGAREVLRATGGWTSLATVYPDLGANRTPQATVLFLEHNAKGGQTIAGSSAGGVINNGYQLRQE